MRELDVNGSTPVGHEIDFDQRTRSVDMGHSRTEIIPAVSLMFDLQ